MGYKDNGVEYGFGQLGSAFSDIAHPVLPPRGMVIVAITFLDDEDGIWYISEAEENTWKDNARIVLSRLNPFNWF